MVRKGCSLLVPSDKLYSLFVWQMAVVMLGLLLFNRNSTPPYASVNEVTNEGCFPGNDS